MDTEAVSVPKWLFHGMWVALAALTVYMGSGALHEIGDIEKHLIATDMRVMILEQHR